MKSIQLLILGNMVWINTYMLSQIPLPVTTVKSWIWLRPTTDFIPVGTLWSCRKSNVTFCIYQVVLISLLIYILHYTFFVYWYIFSLCYFRLRQGIILMCKELTKFVNIIKFIQRSDGVPSVSIWFSAQILF